MGLSMYLVAKKYVSTYSDDAQEVSDKVLEILGVTAPFKISGIDLRVGYWRKANSIHNWFVKNVQDGKDECQESYVSEEQLKELRDTCEKVLADRSLAPVLLPSASGFFFGGTDYDEWYFADLKGTVEIIDGALNLKEFDIYYQACW